MTEATKRSQDHLHIKDIAASHATKIVEAGRQAGLTPTQICKLCELVTSIVVYIEAEREAAGDKVAWAESLLNSMTKRTHWRVAALIRGDTTDEWWR